MTNSTLTVIETAFLGCLAYHIVQKPRTVCWHVEEGKEKLATCTNYMPFAMNTRCKKLLYVFSIEYWNSHNGYYGIYKSTNCKRCFRI